MRDLEETLAKLLKLLDAVGRLPPGPERYELLTEIGRFRVRLDAIVAKREREHSQSAN